MVWNAIEQKLRKTIGLDPKTLGSQAIAKAVRYRMEVCGVENVATYLDIWLCSPQELQALIEETVVPETWFFREPESFEFLRRYVLFDWLPTHPEAILRLLSVPCSTGEEPYSLAMTLLDAGLPPSSFVIDAVDISQKAQIKAEQGLYREHSFRGNQLGFRHRYFQKTPHGYQLSAAVKETVNFIHGNLLEPLFLYGKPLYDIIFFRHLLIYLESDARDRALQVLNRLLSPTGVLLVGSAEAGPLIEKRFISLRHSMTFAYRKRQKSDGTARFFVPPNDPEHSTLSGLQRSPPRTPSRFKPPSQPDPSPAQAPEARSEHPHQSWAIAPTAPSPPKRIPQSPLIQARHLADLGRLNEAAQLCETYISQHRTDANAYVLLGEILQGAGHYERAGQCWEKAIYLEPHHYEALMHLLLLKESHGDLTNACALRQRIQRLLKSQGE
ncbi:CheR family methyltransferase [Oscillatoria acuminata]|uniref:Methylase of chemotaxis methyl-accepting protein n=1 Tax=Oscillatoria acuminata PCC 6304 TaxID=56110 RepID=K9TDU6_9CYAN|nr:protein-glutamate O-methyltransferase CheR [Oscillatoria acuminata]AFY81052.1 methylase of chemotaxis methyl-accepting protein [Oscillatoria acuminata PCC 6304]